MVHYAREQLEERVRLLDGVMNLGYGKRTMFSLRVLVPTLPSSATETKLTKSIKVFRRRKDRHDVENKSVQTELGDGQGEPNISDAEKGENGDVEREKETALLPERIDYILKTESFS